MGQSTGKIRKILKDRSIAASRLAMEVCLATIAACLAYGALESALTLGLRKRLSYAYLQP